MNHWLVITILGALIIPGPALPAEEQQQSQILLMGRFESLGVSPETVLDLTIQMRNSIRTLTPNLSIKELPAPLPANCVEQSGCLTEVKALTKNGFFLETQVHGLGSIYAVNLKLHKLAGEAIETKKIHQTGRRATSTFTETMSHALNALAQNLVPFPIVNLAGTNQSAQPNSTIAKPLYQKWWFWTLVGSVIAGTATATILTLTEDGNSSQSGGITSTGGQVSIDVDIR